MRQSFDEIFNINPRYSTSIAFILGLILIDDLTAPEQNMMGNWLILIGQTILTNASSQNLIESRISGGIMNINSREVKCKYNPPIYDINTIKEIVNKIYPSQNNEEFEILYKAINNLKKEIEALKKE